MVKSVILVKKICMCKFLLSSPAAQALRANTGNTQLMPIKLFFRSLRLPDGNNHTFPGVVFQRTKLLGIRSNFSTVTYGPVLAVKCHYK